MSLESMNCYLKEEKLNGKGNVRIEKLLDILEKMVEDKMWRRIIAFERPNSNNYQTRLVTEAHKKALDIHFDDIKEVGFGEFQVKSSKGETFYSVRFNEVCDTACRTMTCSECK